MEPKDRLLLRVISDYCSDVSSAMERFSLNLETVKNDSDMRAILAFFVQQIGETSSKLSDTFKEAHPEIDWPAIVGFRNRIVHAYGKIIPEILWDTVLNDVPELKRFCEQSLRA